MEYLVKLINNEDILATTSEHIWPVVGQRSGGGNYDFFSFAQTAFRNIVIVGSLWAIFTSFTFDLFQWLYWQTFLFLEIMEVWGWFGPNIIEEVLYAFTETWDYNFFTGFLEWPIHEALSVFLFVDRENHFKPMNEWQAYFFLFVMYPYVYFYSTFYNYTHVSVAPSILQWMIVEPRIMIAGDGKCQNIATCEGSQCSDDIVAMTRCPPREGFPTDYAEIEAIQAMLYGDARYLYYGKNSFNVSWLNIFINYMLNWLQMAIAPFVFLPMFFWLCISTF